MNFLKNYFVNTTAQTDFLQITNDVKYAVRDSGAKNGLVTVVVPGASASVAVFEPIPEVVKELETAFELFSGEGSEALNKWKEKVAVAPRVQAAFLGRSVSVPLKDGKLVLDANEEINLIDFDTKARRREFCVHIAAEDKPAAAAPAGKAPPPRKR